MSTSGRNSRVTKARKPHTSQRKSCDTCHKSKTKCDRQRPVCSTCKIFARNCTYAHDAAPPPQLKPSTSSSSSQRDEENQQEAQFPHNSLIDTSDPVSNNPAFLGFSSTGPFSTELDLIHSTLLTDGLPDSFVHRHTACSCIQQPGCVLASQSNVAQSSASEPTAAQSLLEALATCTDQESTMLLAAIRTGMPVNDIRQVLMDPNYAAGGLAYVLESRRASGDAFSPETRQHQGKLPTFNSHAWETLRYEESMKEQHSPRETFAITSMSAIVEAADKEDSSISIPIWAFLLPRILTQVTDPFDQAFQTMKAEIIGVDIEEYCGTHAHLDVLLHPKSTRKIPRMSRVIAALLSSILPLEASGSTSVTTLAVMWLHWGLFCWLLSPTQANFERIPKMMRPTPWQLFSPHVLIYDFIAVPKLRDYMCREPPEHNTWLTEACKTTRFAWKKTALHALVRHPVTKAIDLCAECKEEAGKPANWSFGPSVRPHLPNIDQYITIRASDQLGSV